MFKFSNPEREGGRRCEVGSFISYAEQLLAWFAVVEELRRCVASVGLLIRLVTGKETNKTFVQQGFHA